MIQALPVHGARQAARILSLPSLGWGLAALAAALAIASRVLLALDPYTLLAGAGPPVWLSVTGQVVGPLVAVLTTSWLGAVVVSREQRNALGWTLMAGGLTLGLTLFLEEYAVLGLVSSPDMLPGARVAAWLQAWLYQVALLWVVVALLLFPDGKLPSRGWLGVVALAAAVTILQIVDSLANPDLLATSLRNDGYPLTVTMPPVLWGLGDFFAGWSGMPAYWLQAWLVPLAAAGLVVRLRAATGEQRQQIKWVAFGGAFAAAGWLVGYVDEIPSVQIGSPPMIGQVDTWGELLWTFGIMIATPVAAVIAVLKYRLYDIDRVIDRTVLVGGLLAFITCVYLVVVIGIGSAFGSGFGMGASLVAAGVAAVGFQPARTWLQGLASRLVYGDRATPYEVLADFADRLGAVEARPEVLTLMARLLGQALDAARTEVWLRVGDELCLEAAWPDSRAPARPVPVVGEELPGALTGDRVLPVWEEQELLGVVCVTKRAGERLPPAEEKLLRDLARQAGLILQNVRLIEELRASRGRIVTALDEERQRLERDIHDGAQQRLVAASLALAVARSRPDAGQLSQKSLDELAEAADQLNRGIAELRDLARGLHPVILTEAGLAAAIESLVERSSLPVELDLQVHSRQPTALETSAYFFLSEALTNAARYSCASSIRVAARECDSRLVLTVIDNGKGGADPDRGSGLRGLQDRLAAVGGSLRVSSTPGGGTTVTAELPCA